MDRWMDGWMDRWMDGWMEKWFIVDHLSVYDLSVPHESITSSMRIIIDHCSSLFMDYLIPGQGWVPPAMFYCRGWLQHATSPPLRPISLRPPSRCWHADTLPQPLRTTTIRPTTIRPTTAATTAATGWLHPVPTDRSQGLPQACALKVP
jgi:hypothetical protein